MKKSLSRDIIIIAACVLVVGFTALCLLMGLVMIPSIVDTGMKTDTQHLAAVTATNLPTQDPIALARRIDAVSAAGNGIVATAFEHTNGGFLRRATTVSKEDGTFAIGTYLDPNSEAYSRLAAGEKYTGPTKLFGRDHMTTYLPIKNASGEVKWATFVGLDFSHAKEEKALLQNLMWATAIAGVLSVLILVGVLHLSLRLLLGNRIKRLQESNERLDRLAHYDQVTDLPNQVLLSRLLRKAVLHANQSGKMLGVCYLDLDGFKAINDAWGEEIGNRLLQDVAHRIQTSINPSDIVARIGVDEFALLLNHAEDLQDIETRLTTLLENLFIPFRFDSFDLNPTASIGATIYPHDANDDELLRHANQAMYTAKQAGKNCFRFFDPEKEQKLKDHLSLLSSMTKALERNEFVLYYQPKVNMREGTVIGAEALIRWRHPERGLLLPLAFLSGLENTELSIVLGEWVIKEALRQMSEWKTQGINLPVSVNIAGNHLQRPDFVSRLSTLLNEFPTLQSQMLELEILETSALENISTVSSIIKECCALGVTFALDDFGTGYSSLTYFRRLPTHFLKIDRSFVCDMLVDAEDKALVNTIITLAKSFGRQVIAEGVETLQHGLSLMQSGCDLAQGYGISRPMPAQDFPAWMHDWSCPSEWRDFSLTQPRRRANELITPPPSKA